MPLSPSLLRILSTGLLAFAVMPLAGAADRTILRYYVTVAQANGRPLADLQPSEFVVTLHGKPLAFSVQPPGHVPAFLGWRGVRCYAPQVIRRRPRAAEARPGTFYSW